MVPWLELLYPAADSEDDTGVLMTNHVACSRPFFMSSVNFFATRLAIAGIEKANRRENQGPPCFRTGTRGGVPCKSLPHNPDCQHPHIRKN